jgi:hypothetical protein
MMICTELYHSHDNQLNDEMQPYISLHSTNYLQPEIFIHAETENERFYIQTLVNTATQSPYCYWTSKNVQQHLLQKFDSIDVPSSKQTLESCSKEENVVWVDPTAS